MVAIDNPGITQNASQQTVLSVSSFKLFIFISFLYLLIAYINRDIILTDEVYYKSLAEKLSEGRIDELLSFQKEWAWLSYCFVPIIYCLKAFLVAVCLFTGNLLSASVKKSFSNFFKVALLGELIFIVSAIVKTAWFLFFKTEYTLMEAQTFSPLSLHNVFTEGAIEEWLAYSVKTVNVFEIIYWAILAYGIKLLTHERYSSSLKMVVYSYGTGLLLWVTLITFISIAMAP